MRRQRDHATRRRHCDTCAPASIPGRAAHQPPILVAGWYPQEIVFAARGGGPFELAYGSRSDVPAALPIATLVPGYSAGKPLPDNVGDATPAATPSASIAQPCAPARRQALRAVGQPRRRRAAARLHGAAARAADAHWQRRRLGRFAIADAIVDSTSATRTTSNVRQHVRHAVLRHLVRRIARAGDRLRRRRLSAGPGADGSRHPARARSAQARHVAPRHAAARVRHGGNPVRRVRRHDDGHADRAPDPQRGRAQQGLREHRRHVPSRPRRLHLLAEVRHPRLPRRRPAIGARDGRARRGRRDRAQVAARALRRRQFAAT